MIYNDVEVYECKFFGVNLNQKLEFTKGVFKGKTPDDFNTINEIQRAVTYCFWVLNKKENSLVSKYMASAFIKELTPKFIQLEYKIRKKIIERQEELAEEAEESTKEVGTKYGEAN